ncbi:hypothetical protein EB169_00620 [archaeon]|nr:hypothetical protein [archaeon]NDB54319.1 hypothetical protein [archaeon]
MNISVNLSNEIRASKDKKVLNKPFRTSKGPKKFSVYVKNDKGNIVKVNFGDPNMEIKRDDPARRKSFRARHKCDVNPGPRWKARYWSCKMWESKKSVTDYTSKGSIDDIIHQWDGITLWEESDLLKLLPSLAQVDEVNDETESEIIDEGYEMALGQLAYVADYSKDLLNQLQNNPDLKMKLEPWVQSKITIIEDYLSSIHSYIMYSQESDTLEIENENELQAGMRVLNVNPTCLHYGSEGLIQSINDLPDNMGKVIAYEVTNEGATYKKGDILTKTIDQLQTLEAAQNAPREGMKSRWSVKYKKSIDCDNPKGFSQQQYCDRQKRGGNYK